ncbi:MAG: alpha/beta fold hydrolase [Verrucomicrobiota bacterium]
MMYLLHGAVGSWRDWLPFRETLESLGQEWSLVDLWREPRISLEEWGTDFSRRAEPDSLLVGYSLGGRLALHALLAEASPFRAGLIISAHPGLPSPAERSERGRSDQAWAEKARSLSWTEFLGAWSAQGVLAGQVEPSDREALEPEREAIAASFENWSLGQQADLRPQLARCAKPLLWLTGERDGKFTRLGQELAGPLVEHRVLSKSGHRVPWEAPQGFSDELVAFAKGSA